MSAWEEWDGTYANGAYDGSPCEICGDETEEPWHALCADCYAEEQGWTKVRVSEVREECQECGDFRVLYPSSDGYRRLCLDCRWPA